MSKSKSKITKGLAFVKTTGEPVYVLGFSERRDLFNNVIPVANVVIGTVTQDGIQHKVEDFDVDMLETRYDQVKRDAERTVLFEQLLQTLREKAEAKRFALPSGIKEAIQKAQATIPSSPKPRIIEEGL